MEDINPYLPEEIESESWGQVTDDEFIWGRDVVRAAPASYLPFILSIRHDGPWCPFESIISALMVILNPSQRPHGAFRIDILQCIEKVIVLLLLPNPGMEPKRGFNDDHNCKNFTFSPRNKIDIFSPKLQTPRQIRIDTKAIPPKYLGWNASATLFSGLGKIPCCQTGTLSPRAIMAVWLSLLDTILQ